jgi:hypothetical protein
MKYLRTAVLSMPEVITSSDDLSILGGPAKIDLSLDSGAQGQRGTFILYGFANPNTEEAKKSFIAEPQVFDLYVVVDPTSENYLQIFQYINRDGSFIWIPAIKLSINQFGTTVPTVFGVDGPGLATIKINISDLGLAGIFETGQSQSIDLNFFDQPGSAAYFNVQASIMNFNPLYVINPTGEESLNLFPLSYTYVISDVYLDEIDGQLKLPITFYAVELTPLGPIPVEDKALFVQLLISLQNPSKIEEFFTELILGGS